MQHAHSRFLPPATVITVHTTFFLLIHETLRSGTFEGTALEIRNIWSPYCNIPAVNGWPRFSCPGCRVSLSTNKGGGVFSIQLVVNEQAFNPSVHQRSTGL
ncbi:hypothetical protein ILYODFUR_033009 [Ilyodon furcidens]|uniref:Uncharacterized protein n=1 Tax=Ilyodon furcidens TaxID=33524 RepID=A0ABV0STB1_9TELE